MRRAKDDTAARAGRSAAADPENLASPCHSPIAPSERRPAHAAQAPTELVHSEVAKERVMGWRRKWHSLRCAEDGVQPHALDRSRLESQESKALVSAAERPSAPIRAWHRQWKSCGSLHWLKADDADGDGPWEALAALSGALNIEVCRTGSKKARTVA